LSLLKLLQQKSEKLSSSIVELTQLISKSVQNNSPHKLSGKVPSTFFHLRWLQVALGYTEVQRFITKILKVP